MQHLLAISGSLRAASSNTCILQAARLVAPAGLHLELYDDLGRLPHFNPDLEEKPPQEVVALRERVGHVAGLLISCPEYARGIPGTFKNALDWLVGSETFPNKPVALINTSARASAAQASLRLVLTTMSARLVEEASITIDLLGKRITPETLAADPTIASTLVKSLETFARALDADLLPNAGAPPDEEDGAQ